MRLQNSVAPFPVGIYFLLPLHLDECTLIKPLLLSGFHDEIRTHGWLEAVFEFTIVYPLLG